MMCSKTGGTACWGGSGGSSNHNVVCPQTWLRLGYFVRLAAWRTGQAGGTSEMQPRCGRAGLLERPAMRYLAVGPRQATLCALRLCVCYV